jgi:branched-chain amino acid aminotransferase
MKAYRSDGAIRLFRPDQNMVRLNRSTARLALPPIDADGFLGCIKELVRTDQDWIPQAFGYSLYIRPTVISTYVCGRCAALRCAALHCIALHCMGLS